LAFQSKSFGYMKNYDLNISYTNGTNNLFKCVLISMTINYISCFQIIYIAAENYYDISIFIV